MYKTTPFKCDDCGRFIAYGSGQSNMVTPDSEYTYETWEHLCDKCVEKVNNLRRPIRDER